MAKKYFMVFRQQNLHLTTDENPNISYPAKIAF